MPEAIDLAKDFDITDEKNPHYTPRHEANLDELSESDRLILDEVAVRYGSMTFDQLYQLTHDLAAYTRAWKGGEVNHYPMRFEDFFAETPDREPVLREIREEQQLRRLFASVSA